MINLIDGEIVNNVQKISEEIGAETVCTKNELFGIDELKNEVLLGVIHRAQFNFAVMKRVDLDSKIREVKHSSLLLHGFF